MPVRFLPLPPVVVRHGSGLVASFGFPFMVLMVCMSLVLLISAMVGFGLRIVGETWLMATFSRCDAWLWPRGFSASQCGVVCWD